MSKNPEIDPHVVTTVKSIMLQHQGSENSISYDELTYRIYGKATENNRRKLRAVVSAINADPTNRVIICSDRDDGGLFMNGTTEVDMEKHRLFMGQEESQAVEMLNKTKAMWDKYRDLYPGQGRLL